MNLQSVSGLLVYILVFGILTTVPPTSAAGGTVIQITSLFTSKHGSAKYILYKQESRKKKLLN